MAESARGSGSGEPTAGWLDEATDVRGPVAAAESGRRIYFGTGEPISDRFAREGRCSAPPLALTVPGALEILDTPQIGW